MIQSNTNSNDIALNRLLILAIRGGSSVAVKTVISQGFVSNATDRNGRTALHLASIGGSLDICQILWSAGCDPNVKDRTGKNCAALALDSGHVILAKFLGSASRFDKIQEVPGAQETETPEIEPILDEWEVEEASDPPAENIVVSRAVWNSTQKFSNIKPASQFDASWDDVEVIQIKQTLKKTNFEALFQDSERISKILTTWLRSEWVYESDIEGLGGSLSKSSFQQIKHNLHLLLETEGILVTNKPNNLWAEASESYQPEEKNEIDLLDYLEFLEPVPSSADTSIRWIEQIPNLSRFDEEALFNKLLRSRQEIIHSISNSPEVISYILGRIELIFNEHEEFENFSDADLVAVKASIEGAEINEDKIDDFTTECEIGLVLTCPNRTNAAFKFVQAIDRLSSRFRTQSNPYLDGTAMQEVSRDLTELALSSTFLRHCSERLDQEEVHQPLAANIRKWLDASEYARQKLIRSHLPKAIRMAAKFKGRGLELEDLFQIAAMGVMRTIEMFDPSRGNRFWTLANFWVRQYLSRAIDNEARTVRIPVHALFRLKLISRAKRDLGKILQNLHSHDAVAHRAGLSIDMVAASEAYLQFRLSDKFLPEVGQDEIKVEDRIFDQEIVGVVEGYLRELPDRQQDILARRFGLRKYEEHTLEQIGQIYGVTRERIRQIEAKALRYLRQPVRARKLREVLRDA